MNVPKNRKNKRVTVTLFDLVVFENGVTWLTNPKKQTNKRKRNNGRNRFNQQLTVKQAKNFQPLQIRCVSIFCFKQKWTYNISRRPKKQYFFFDISFPNPVTRFKECFKENKSFNQYWFNEGIMGHKRNDLVNSVFYYNDKYVVLLFFGGCYFKHIIQLQK